MFVFHGVNLCGEVGLDGLYFFIFLVEGLGQAAVLIGKLGEFRGKCVIILAVFFISGDCLGITVFGAGGDFIRDGGIPHIWICWCNGWHIVEDFLTVIMEGES